MIIPDIRHPDIRLTAARIVAQRVFSHLPMGADPFDTLHLLLISLSPSLSLCSIHIHCMDTISISRFCQLAAI